VSDNVDASWPYKPIGDLLEAIIDYRGKTPPKSPFGITVLTAANIRNGSVDLSSVSYVTQETYDRWMTRGFPQPGDVLITTEAPVGEVASLPGDQTYLVSRRLMALRGRLGELDNDFLKYSLLHPDNRNRLLQSIRGSTVPRVLKTDITGLQIPVPPLSVQRRIVNILGALDDKIEVNRRINRTLEAMAQALYKHWFVDFGPFQDAEFVESELGLIPKGWEVGKIDTVASVNPEAIRGGREPHQIIYVDISSVSTGQIDSFLPLLFAEAPSRARRLVKHGDIIWSAVRPNRRSFSLIQHPEKNLVVSTGFAVIRPEKVPYSYLYAALSIQEFTDYLTARATGAAYPAVTADDFKSAIILMPEEEVLKDFHKYVEPWLEQKYILQQETSRLAETRDYLLPRLLSGEVPVEVGEEAIVGADRE
jgi:type I restriction enzyme S subunit